MDNYWSFAVSLVRAQAGYDAAEPPVEGCDHDGETWTTECGKVLCLKCSCPCLRCYREGRAAWRE